MSIKRNIVANVVGRFYAMGSLYVFVLFYVSILGIDRYGVIAFYAILLTIGSVADVGLSATLSREAAREKDPERLRDLVTTMERILLASTLLFGLAIFLAAEAIARNWLNSGGAVATGEVTTSLRLMALMVAPQLGISLYTAGLLGLERQVSANVILITFVTVRGGLIIPLLYLQPSLLLFFSWQLAATVAFFLIARGSMMRALGFGAFAPGRPRLEVLKPVMGFAGGILAFTILSTINTQMDKLIVSKMFSIAEFGYYSLASTLALLPAAVVGPLLSTLLPRLTRMISEGDEPAASALFARFTRLISGLSGVGAMGLLFFAPEVFAIWLGGEQVLPEAVTVVRILAMGGLFLAISSPPFYLGLAHGHNRTSVVIGICTLVFAIPLLIVGSVRFGLIGAAWPWLLINLSAFTALSIVVVRQYYRGPVLELILGATFSPILVCVVALAIARWVATSLDAPPILACAIAGAFGVAALGVIGASELRTILASRFSRRG